MTAGADRPAEPMARDVDAPDASPRPGGPAVPSGPAVPGRPGGPGGPAGPRPTDRPDVLRAVDNILVEQADRIEDLLAYHRNQVQCPIYASVDVRRSRFKAAVVDANAFPAGFNNLAARSHDVAARAIASYVRRTYPEARQVLVLGEGHTRNKGYFENLAALRSLFAAAGYDVVLGTLNEELFPQAEMETISGKTITLHGVLREGDDLVAGGMVPDLVILNNDLAEGSPAILDGLRQPVTPPPSMGWHRRRKGEHFRIVAELARQLGAYAGFDPWCISALHERVDGVDFRGRTGIEEVAAAAGRVLAATQKKYDEYDVRRPPTVFIKADPGTYGMGIMTASSAEDVLSLNARGREKMDRGKGRVKTTSVLVQEGVPTDVRAGPGHLQMAEPVIYMVCGRVVGGFHRVHAERGELENLNAPGGRFEPLVLGADGPKGPDEGSLDAVSAHIYQVLGEIASIATGYELRFADQPGHALPQYP